MNNGKKTVLTGLAGAALLAGAGAQAQTFTYSADDLLLNFRNTANITGPDLEVDAGPVSSVVSVAGTQELVAPSVISGVYGGPPSSSSPIGFSATAADATGTDGIFWITREDSTPGTAPTSVSAQQTYSTQNKVNLAINNIGSGAQSGTVVQSQVAYVSGGTSGLNYQAQAEQSTSVSGQQTINFGGNENIAESKGGLIESVQDASAGDVYEALWEVPATTTKTGGVITPTPTDTYEGYFTFQPDGEVDFTSATAAPEPSTYVFLLGTGAGWLAMRRKSRS